MTGVLNGVIARTLCSKRGNESSVGVSEGLMSSLLQPPDEVKPLLCFFHSVFGPAQVFLSC